MEYASAIKHTTNVGENSLNPLIAFFEKLIGVFPKLDILKMSKIEKSLENVVKKTINGFNEFFILHNVKTYIKN